MYVLLYSCVLTKLQAIFHPSGERIWCYYSWCWKGQTKAHYTEGPFFQESVTRKINK